MASIINHPFEENLRLLLLVIKEVFYQHAMNITVTDAFLDSLTESRREAATDVNYWVAEKKATKDREYAKFCKEQEKDARKLEKAANIWIDHFTKIGYRNIEHHPAELKTELSLVLGRASFVA